MEVLQTADSVTGWRDGLRADANLWFHGLGNVDSGPDGHLLTTLSDLTGMMVSANPSEPVLPSQGQRLELVFVDPDTPNYRELLDDLARDAGDRRLEVIVLDDDRDGVAQISAALQRHQDVGAVHLISHGSDGAVELGGSRLSHANVDGYRSALSQWAASLQDRAELRGAGSDLAASETGRALIETIATATGADVAASDDLTGHASLGGDWDLEYRAGLVESQVVVSEAAQMLWRGTLASISFQQGVDAFSGTQDAHVNEGSPDSAFGSGATINADLDGGGGLVQGLIRFDGLFGNGPGQIPYGSTINSASLTLEVVDTSSGGAIIGLHRMLIDWDESSTWNSLGAGLQAGSEFASAADSVLSAPTSAGQQALTGLEATLQGWSDGAANYGWAITSDSNNGIDFTSSEGGTVALRPVLTVDYTPHTVVVNTTSDVADGDTSSIEALRANSGADGVVSLREALLAANATAGADTIEFSIAEPLVNGAHRIDVTSALPTVTDTVILDGWSEPDHADAPVIRLDGAAAGAGVSGLSFSAAADGSVVRGLMITGFSSDGILVQSGADCLARLPGNWIGTAAPAPPALATATTASTCAAATLPSADSERTRIGNVITNAGDEGVTVVGSGVTGHVIQGNIIGLDPDGASGSGNADVGLAVHLRLGQPHRWNRRRRRQRDLEQLRRHRDQYR